MRSSPVLRSVLLIATISLASLPRAAHGEPPAPAKDGAKDDARKLADEGQRFFVAKKYSEAIEKLREADSKYPAPTIKLAWAEAHEKLGELRAAREVYLRIAQTDLDPEAPTEFVAAKESAKAAVARLDRAIPRIFIEILGQKPPFFSLHLDGKALPAHNRPIRLDPGTHALRIEMSGKAPEIRKKTLREGETWHIQLIWEKARREPSPARIVHKVSPPSLVAPAISFGVGGAGLVTGAIAGGIALSKMQQFRSQCGPDLACPEALADDVQNARAAGHISTIGFALAGAGAALGALLLVLPGRQNGHLEVGITPSSLVVKGGF